MTELKVQMDELEELLDLACENDIADESRFPGAKALVNRIARLLQDSGSNCTIGYPPIRLERLIAKTDS